MLPDGRTPCKLDKKEVKKVYEMMGAFFEKNNISKPIAIAAIGLWLHTLTAEGYEFEIKEDWN